ncbi:ribosomal protein uL16 3-hydroxylase [Chitinibacteraceae bacterium HSL-7]
MPNTLLGGMTPETFLRDYWQKKPLLIRGAVPNFAGRLSPDEFLALAARDDVEARLIEYRNERWHLERGPLSARRLANLPERDWTVLVQDVNHHYPAMAELLYRFSFLPYYRLDDLMISYAPEGGSVGPHYDSYDVFLLQIGGSKRWQISSDDAGNFIEDAPIRVLKDFNAEEEWILEDGDMLYLPPKYAHHGVALEPGMTYSIGFRAPKTQEIASQFLDFMQDELCVDGMYADPQRELASHPGQIDAGFREAIAGMLERIRWDDDMVARFTGRYFTEPKPHVFFETPDDALDYDAFAQALAESGVTLDLKSMMLYDEHSVYLNGEVLEAPESTHALLHVLADTRALQTGDYDDEIIDILFDAYDCGYLHPTAS